MALKLKELAAQIGGEVVGDGETLIERVAPIEEAGPGEITFVSNPKYLNFVRTTKAAAIIVAPALRAVQRNMIVMSNPYLGFARAVTVLMKQALARPIGVHPTAVISPKATLGKDVSVGPHVIIEDGAVIADRVTLMAGVYVGPNVKIGEDTWIHPNTTLYHNTRIGKNCLIHANVSIGSDGFGWAPEGRHYVAIPQVGVSVIGDDVSIGANSVINRGGLGDTTIGNGTKIDSLVVVSHNVKVGADCLLVSLVGISGSAEIGEHVTLGGQVGVAGHLKIGDNVQVAAQSGVSHTLEPNKTYFGTPARPMSEMKRTVAALHKLPELREEIRHVRKRMAEITAMLDEDVHDGKAAQAAQPPATQVPQTPVTRPPSQPPQAPK